MRKNVYIDQEHVRDDAEPTKTTPPATGGAAESTVDSVRGRRVRRLPRGDGAPRVLARAAHVAAIRRQGPPLSPGDVLDWIRRGAPTRVS